MKVVDPRQSVGLLKAASGGSLHIPVLLAITTGMRSGEILALRWQDVQLDTQTLQVVQTLEQTAGGLAFNPHSPDDAVILSVSQAVLV